jgi:phosphoribosylamine--glycine ligase
MVIIEQGLLGPELSLQAWCDGENYRMIPFGMRDHKTIYANDEGPMTGGMGVVTIPNRDISIEDIEIMGELFVAPVLKWLKDQGAPFKGMLFPGIKGGRCLEYNARPGDPEAQAWLARLKSDVVELMIASATGQLDTLQETKWDNNESVSMVVAAEGYPGAPIMGAAIEGIDEIAKLRSYGVNLLHAGTTVEDGKLRVNGGRVLNVIVKGQNGESLRSVCDRAKFASMLVRFEGRQFRNDLGDSVIQGEYEDYVTKNVA